MLDFISFLGKGISGIAKGLVWLLTKAGLWVPCVYSLLFLIVALATGTTLADIKTIYFIGLILTTVFGVGVTIYLAFSKLNRRTQEDMKEKASSPLPKKRGKKVELVEGAETPLPIQNNTEENNLQNNATSPQQYPQQIVAGVPPVPMYPFYYPQPYFYPQQPPPQPQPPTQSEQDNAGKTQFSPYISPSTPPAPPQSTPQQNNQYQAPTSSFAPQPPPQSTFMPYNSPKPPEKPYYPEGQNEQSSRSLGDLNGRRIYGADDYVRFGDDTRNTSDRASRLYDEYPSLDSRTNAETPERSSRMESRFEPPSFDGKRYDEQTRQRTFNRTNESFLPARSGEQPRIFRTKMDDKILIYEYSDRLDFYQITPSGLVLLSSEPKRQQ